MNLRGPAKIYIYSPDPGSEGESYFAFRDNDDVKHDFPTLDAAVRGAQALGFKDYVYKGSLWKISKR